MVTNSIKLNSIGRFYSIGEALTNSRSETFKILGNIKVLWTIKFHYVLDIIDFIFLLLVS